VEADLGDQVAFLGIGSQAGVEEMQEFVDRWDLSGFPQAADPDGELWARFADDVIRSSFLFIDAETGAAERTGYGELDESELRQRAQALAAD
jgi:hypothetical protein